jgi:hypothetical protein
MKSYQKLIAFCCILFFAGCNSSADYSEKNSSDSTATNIISSSAAVEDPKESTRKFIRTADLKFKTNDVIKATYDIEEITNRHQGFVTSTTLQSDIDSKVIVPVTADSSLETTYYTVSNTMMLRVPNHKLDTTLKDIAKNVGYLEYRIIKADDVSLQLLSNEWSGKREIKTNKRLTAAIDNKGKKLDEIVGAEEVLANAEAHGDDAKLSNLSLMDRIEFSTVTLSIYQRQAKKTEIISSNKTIEPYKPSFTSKFADAAKFGWDALESIALLITRLWAIILLGVMLYLGFKTYRQQFRKVMP